VNLPLVVGLYTGTKKTMNEETKEKLNEFLAKLKLEVKANRDNSENQFDWEYFLGQNSVLIKLEDFLNNLKNEVR
jgi:sugar-specific transcriptional regulator TrmB